jgi:hypothetical protein
MESSFPRRFCTSAHISGQVLIFQGQACPLGRAFTTSAEQIINWFVTRWGLEVAFEEAREHLGMETQRQWSDLAIARATPIILGLFSLVTIFASKLQGDGKIPVLTTAWYQKTEATFSDCLALARKHLWDSGFHVKSARKADFVSLPKQEWEHLISCLSAAA